MRRLKGIGASQGIAIGRLALFEQLVPGDLSEASEQPTPNAKTETMRLETAFSEARLALESLRQRTLLELGSENATIFEVQQMLLDDVDMRDRAMELIETENYKAEDAIRQVAQDAADMMSAVEDAYIRERKADIIDLSNRVMGLLRGLTPPSPSQMGGQFVLRAHELLPSEMIEIDRKNVLAIVCRDGSEMSHAAILARTMGIPAVLRLGHEQYEYLRQYDTVVVDGFRGELVVQPDERTLAHYRDLRAQYLENRERLKKLCGLPSRTVDGLDIVISAQMGAMEDLDAVIENDAQEIGLFRPPLFGAEHKEQSTEQARFTIYREILQRMGRRRLTVCPDGFLRAVHEWTLLMQTSESATPHPKSYVSEDFATHLRALLRASYYGRVALVLPMVVSVQQVETAHAMLEVARNELRLRGQSYGELEIGAMIETPSAALISDQLVWMADFFLIHVDSLTRHILLTDSGGYAAEDYHLYHPATMRAVRMVAEACARRNIRCALCNWTGVGLERTEDFLALGVNEFVVAPSEVLPVRKKVRETDLGRRWMPPDAAISGRKEE